MASSVAPGNIFDAFVKRMFGRILVFADFLAHYADPKFVDEMDLRKIRPAPTHYIGKDGSERIADLVFQCPLENGTGTLTAVIVFEHQGGGLRRIPRKLHKYISAIWDAEAKEGRKTLSAPYFIVLRTAKRPHREPYPKMSDSLPKDRNGKPLGRIPEIEYDVVDLPAWDFRNLVGGPVLRLALGILKKMVEGTEDEFPEALLPLREIVEEDQQLELTKELLDFVAKAMAAHNDRLDAERIDKALKPIYREKERTMIKTIFEEKYDEGYLAGVAEGKVEGKVEGKAEGETQKGRSILLKVLRMRFTRIPKSIETTVNRMTDPTSLESLAVHAAVCESIAEFEKALR